MQTSHSDLAISAATTIRNVGGTSLSVESGAGALFNVVDGPMRVVVYRADPTSVDAPPIFITLLWVTAVSGDVLTIGGAADAHADAAVAIGDTLANVPTAGDLKDLWTAVLAAGGGGNAFRQGAGAPSNSLGVDGDWYIDNTIGDLYQRVSGSYGAPLLRGYAPVIWQTGTVDPPAGGIEGDIYVKNPPGDLYQIQSGAWVLIANLKGPTGAAGATGATGPAYSTLGTANQVLGTNNAATDFEYKTITAGSGVTITHSTGAVTIAATGGGGGSGTVTSVGLTAFSGISVTGSPITGAGTLALSTSLSGLIYGTGYSFISAVANVDYVQPSGNITGTAAGLSSTLAVASGGTGLTTLGTSLQTLRVNAGGTALEYATPSGGGGGGIGSLVATDDGTTVSLITPEKMVVIGQTGGDQGTASLKIVNQFGETGLTLNMSSIHWGDIKVNASVSGSPVSSYLRMEAADSFCALGLAPEWQFGHGKTSPLTASDAGLGVTGAIVVTDVANPISPPKAMLDIRGSVRLHVDFSAGGPTVHKGGTECVFAISPTAATDVNLDADLPDGQIITIKDKSGAASTSNITINATSGKTIDGAATYVINTNYGSVTIVSWGDGTFGIIAKVV